MSWMTTRATLKMTETELTRRHSVRTVSHINMVGLGVGWQGWVVGWLGGWVVVSFFDFSPKKSKNFFF